MIRDHKPYRLKQLFQRIERWYADHFLTPQFEHFGAGHFIMKPWNVKVHGRHISIGSNVHIIADAERKVSLSSWTFGDHQGRITIGDNVLLCPGVRIDSASGISIGDNCMFAAGSYITDADWHDIYDRTETVGNTRPIKLETNVWIGDGAIVCKGVTIGENSVIGAGSVVASDIPANVIAAGNPAQVIKPLDESRELITRETIFADIDALHQKNDAIDRYVLYHNTWIGWLRSLLFPKRGD